MKANEILKADILDLLFEGRNKIYGAYTLRKNYNKRLIASVVISAVLTFLVISLLRSALSEQPDRVYASKDVVLHHIELPEVVPPPPPPPPPVKEETPAAKKPESKISSRPKMQVQKLKTTKFTPPVIREDSKVTEQEFPPLEEMAKIDVVTADGIESDKVTMSMPPETASMEGIENSNAVVEKPKEDENKIFEKVEIEASVNASRWRRHLENRLLPYIEDAANAGMAAGQYTVMVRFLVEKNGSIEDVKALNDPGYGLAEGAEQVVKTGPRWEPGIQNGQKVRSYHTQPITFVIMDS